MDLPIESLFIWAIPNLWGLYQECKSCGSEIHPHNIKYSLSSLDGECLPIEGLASSMSRPHDFEHFKNVAAQKFTHTMLNILSHALMENVCQLKG
jgi:hypothetical protein